MGIHRDLSNATKRTLTVGVHAKPVVGVFEALWSIVKSARLFVFSDAVATCWNCTGARVWSIVNQTFLDHCPELGAPSSAVNC